jgi:deoxyribose-phosphate aldolase
MSERAAVARRAIGLIDLTDLGDAPTPADIERLCQRAVAAGTAAVCVWPPFVAQCVGAGVRVATVVNFPAGGEDVAATVAETATALDDGAAEIDLVLPYRAFLDGRVGDAAAMVTAVRAAVAEPAHLKVILESGSYPSLDHVRAAARLAIDHGADFVKTSTGKTAVSATIAASVMILDAIRSTGRPVGFKPSGGIRTLDDAARYLAVADEMMGPAWATPETFRFGASGLLDALEAEVG